MTAGVMQSYAGRILAGYSADSGDENIQMLPVPTGDRFQWEGDSTYIRRQPFLDRPIG